MWLPPEENHEVIGFVRAFGGEGHCGGEGQGRGGAQLAHNKHMLHCVRQEHFTYTQTIGCMISCGSLVCPLHPVCVHMCVGQCAKGVQTTSMQRTPSPRTPLGLSQGHPNYPNTILFS